MTDVWPTIDPLVMFKVFAPIVELYTGNETELELEVKIVVPKIVVDEVTVKLLVVVTGVPHPSVKAATKVNCSYIVGVVVLGVIVINDN